MNVPADLTYTEEHEWIARTEGGSLRIGITDYAQDQLGDIVYVDLPDPGRDFAKGDVIAEVESTKSVGEIYAPFAGTVIAVNDGVAETPEVVNSDPFGAGWLVEMTSDDDLSEGFLDADAYRTLID